MIGFIYIISICFIGLFLFLLFDMYSKKEGYKNTDVNSDIETDIVLKSQLTERFSSDAMNITQIVLIVLILAMYLTYMYGGSIIKKFVEFLKRLYKGWVLAIGKYGGLKYSGISTNPAREAGSIDKAIRKAQKDIKPITPGKPYKASKTTDDLSTKKPGQITSGLQRRVSVSGARSGTPLLDIQAAKDWSKSIKIPTTRKVITSSQDDYFGFKIPKTSGNGKLMQIGDVQNPYMELHTSNVPMLHEGRIVKPAFQHTPGLYTPGYLGVYSPDNISTSNIGLLGNK